MTRHDTPRGRRRSHTGLPSQTVAASALGGGCLAVVALWKTAARDGGSESAAR